MIVNHYSESVSALGWVVVAPTPAPYIKEMNDAGQFYTNRYLDENIEVVYNTDPHFHLQY